MLAVDSDNEWEIRFFPPSFFSWDFSVQQKNYAIFSRSLTVFIKSKSSECLLVDRYSLLPQNSEKFRITHYPHDPISASHPRKSQKRYCLCEQIISITFHSERISFNSFQQKSQFTFKLEI